MCNLYTGADEALYDSESRSIRIQGCVTSIRLENEFWQLLDEMAGAEAVSTPRFINVLYEELLEKNGEVKNFASFLRVACCIYTSRGRQAPTLTAPQMANSA